MDKTIITADSKEISRLIEKAIINAVPAIAEELSKKQLVKPIWLSRKDYAKLNGISIQMVDKMRRQDKLTYKKVGSRMLIKG